MLSDSHFMRVAGIISEAGTCSRLQVGAVIVRDRRVVSVGYNGAPSGMPHCSHRGVEGYKVEIHGPPVPPPGPCTIAVHAEANAICFAAKNGISTDKASLYTTDSPCLKCAELIVNAGIIEVIYEREYRIDLGINLLQAARVHVAQFDGSNVRTVSPSPGYGQGVYPGKRADSQFDEGWTAAADDNRRRGTRV